MKFGIAYFCLCLGLLISFASPSLAGTTAAIRARLQRIAEMLQVKSTHLSGICGEQENSVVGPELQHLRVDVDALAGHPGTMDHPHFFSDQAVIEMINQPPMGGKKLEVGAAGHPLCRSGGCVFADLQKQGLTATEAVMRQNGISDATYIHERASAMPSVKDASISRVVSKGFPWLIIGKKECEEIMREYQRVLTPDGKIVILSAGRDKDWKAKSFQGWFKEPLAAAQAQGFGIEYLVTPSWDGFILKRISAIE
jgi:hypothetical protein